MEKMLAFVYNVRHAYPDPKDPRTFLEADYDDPETIEIFIKHLKKCGFKVLALEADGTIKEKLQANKSKIGLVLNYSEVIVGGQPGQQVSSACETLRIPFTGSSDKTQLLIRNKAKAKRAMKQAGIPVLADQVFKSEKEKLRPGLQFPLIVKPIAQGSSAGITNKSVVRNEWQLRRQVKAIIDNFKDAALVEPFINGREFSVSLLGNPPEILPIIEPNLATLPKNFEPIESLEVKWVYEEKVKHYLQCPAKIEPKLKAKIELTVLKVWSALKIRDLCRIDTRCDDKGNLYVLEVNSPPGLMPPEISQTSYLPLAARKKGISYEQLLMKIVELALARQKHCKVW